MASRVGSPKIAVRERLAASDPSQPTVRVLPHVTAVRPETIPLESNPILSAILEKMREQVSPAALDAKRKAGVGALTASDHWLLSVPESLRRSERDVVNYLGMVVAIDFRHWAELPPLAAVGEVVKGFTNFFCVVDADEEPKTEEERNALHPEHNAKDGDTADAPKRTLIRGSAAMMYLLKRGVEKHHVMWYDPSYLCQFRTLAQAEAALKVCFEGCQEDGVTPLMMPATRERVELLLSMAKALQDRKTSFHDLLCRCDGYLFRPPECSKPGFVDSLIDLHPRYLDVSPWPAMESGQPAGPKVPILKLSQLTAITLGEVLPVLWRWLHSTGDAPDTAKANTWLEKAEQDVLGGGFKPLFLDDSDLAMCCDYQIPRALRAAGVLVYDEHLADCVDRGVLIAPNSTEEVCIRLGTILGSEMLLDFMNSNPAVVGAAEGITVNASQLDYALWYVGRYMSYATSRHHLCRAIMY